ncbi:probable rhodanese domain-containing dual specificity protein phosphatase [Clytia hemisphaerica]|eukprot:TCONS_00004286-protein
MKKMGCGYSKLLSKQHKSSTKPFDEDAMRDRHVSTESKENPSSQGHQDVSKTSNHFTIPSIDDLPLNKDSCITMHDLYNLLNDGAMKMYIHDPFNLLLIDGRELDLYSTQHVITAKHHSIFGSDSNFVLRLSNYGMVIIYGSELQVNKSSTDSLLKLRAEVQEYVASDVLVLVEGFDQFHLNYPFLCTDKLIETVADRKELLCYPSMVLDSKLFQGRGDQATNENIIDVLKITHIVNITLEHQNAFPKKVKYFRLELDDVGESNLFEHFHKTSDFINEALSTKIGRVLVHCNMGVSRSSTITLAYLMKYKQWSLDLAFKTLKSRRSCAAPNDGFLQQLSKWEIEMLGQKLTDIDSLF